MHRQIANGRLRQGFPVAPGALPILGHLPVLYRDAPGVLCRAREAVGPLFWIHMGFGTWNLFCVGPESLSLLRHQNVSIEDAYSVFGFMAGRSVFAMDGLAHQRVRSAINPAFSPHGFAQHGAGEIMAKVLTERVSSWDARGRIPLLTEMEELTIDVLFRVTGVGTDRLPIWREKYRDFAMGVYPIPIELPGFPRRRSKDACEWMNAALRAMIAEARSGAAGEGLVHVLLHARGEDGERLAEDAVVDNLRMILFAGHETTASTLAFMVIRLATNAPLWSALLDEVNGAEGAVPASLKEARQFPVAEAIFRETLRLHNPIWFIFRKTVDWVSFGGYRIPPRTLLSLSPAAMGRDPALFADPERFDPSRWLDRSAPASTMALSAFGGGVHICVGYSMVWLEAVQFLVALARTMSRRGVHPRLAAGSGARQVYFPLGHPPRSTRVEFSATRGRAPGRLARWVRRASTANALR